MARQVLPIVGFVVGSYFGVPQLGYMIGSLVGNAVDPQVFKGPRIGDIGVQTSRDGVPRPIVFGTAPVVGNVIDRGAYIKTIHREQQGKGGPVTETERVSLTFAIRICEGPIIGVSRIWEDEKLVYDVRPGSTFTADSAKFARKFQLYTGSESQLPDPDLESIHGVGTTPAYRGTAYIVFPNKDLTERRGSIPNYRFEVVGLGDETIQPSNCVALLKFNGENNSSTFIDETGRIWSQDVGVNAVLSTTKKKFGPTSLKCGPSPSYCVTATSPDFAFGSEDFTIQIWCYPTSFGLNRTLIDMEYDAGFGPQLQVDASGYLDFKCPGPATRTSDRKLILDAWNLVEVSKIGSSSYLFVNGVLSNTYTGGFAIASTNLRCAIGARINTGNPFIGYIDTVRIFKGEGLHSATYPMPGADFELTDDITTIDGDPIALSFIVETCCNRAGVTDAQIDTSELTDMVTGFVIAGMYSSAECIKSLQRVYFFDSGEWDGVLHFVKRGGDVVDSFTEDDFLEEAETTLREQELEFPVKLHLAYQNANLGYAPTKQTVTRSSPDIRVVGEVSVEVPVVLDEDQAIQTADKLMKTAWVDAAGDIKFKLPDNKCYLTPTDCINLNIRSRTFRARIERIEAADGVLDIQARHDRVSSYESTLTGSIARDPLEAVSQDPGVTFFEFMNIPALIDSHDKLGYYVAICGEKAAWAGALVERSIDAGANFSPLGVTNSGTIMGRLLDVLPQASEYVMDTTNELRFQILGPDNVDIQSVSYATMLQENNACLVGDEIIQYQDAVEESAGVWVLTNLLRGRLATATAQHEVGVRFVVLAGAAFVETSTALLGLDLTHRATSITNEVEDSDQNTTTWTPGNSQLEFAPCFLDLERDLSDVITGSFVPRYRFGTSINPIASINDKGFRITLDDGSTTVTLPDQLGSTFTYDASALGPSVTVTVGGVNRITGLGATVSGVI